MKAMNRCAVFILILAAVMAPAGLYTSFAQAQNNYRQYKLPGRAGTAVFFLTPPVIYNIKRQVVQGTLVFDRQCNLPDRAGPATFMAGTRVFFNNEGKVTQGAMRTNRQCNIPGGGTANFLAGTYTSFNGRGEVTSGVLATDRQCKGISSTVTFTRGSRVTFGPTGIAALVGGMTPMSDVAPATPAAPASISSILGTWKNTDHIHQGCKSVQSFCKAYKVDLLFSQEPGGKLKAQLVGQQVFLTGALQGLTWNVEVTMNGAHHGNGVFVFSPDCKSFKGEFTDVSGHHVIWTGSR